MKTVKRRRKQGKTDYGNRIKLLKSNSPRIVFRKTNKYVIAQCVTSSEAQDKIEIGISSKNLMKYGWPEKQKGSLKSLPASYLTGLLMGKKIIEKKIKTPIVDFGMIKALHKTKVFAFLKGLIDAGIKIQCKQEVFPSEERITGTHMKEDFSKTFNEIKSRIEEK